MGFTLAELFVSIKADDDPLQNKVRGIHSQLTGMGVAIGTAAGNLLASAVKGAASAVAGFIGDSISGAMSLQDTMSATDAIFGESSSVIFKWADDMAAQFGAAKNETILAAQQFGASFKAIGMGKDEAAKLGTELAKLGMDMASFKGARNEEAFIALSAALRGEFDPLERFNVQLTAASVGAEAVRMGLAKNATQLDENAKKQATLSLIMQKTMDQQGDLERTSDQSTNTWNRLTGTIQNLAAELGTTLMPAITAVLNLGADMVGSLSKAFEANKDTIASWAKSFAEAVKGIPQFWDEFQTGVATSMLRLGDALEYTKQLANWSMSAAGQAGLGGMPSWAKVQAEGSQRAIDQLVDDLRRRTEERTKGVEPKPPRTPALELPTYGAEEGAKKGGFLDRLGLGGMEIKDADYYTPTVKDPNKRLSALEELFLDNTGIAEKLIKQRDKEAEDKAHPFRSEALSSEDFYSRLVSAGLSGKDDREEKKLAAQQKTAENTQRMADALIGGLPARLS